MKSLNIKGSDAMKTHAVLTIKEACSMSKKGRKDIAAWLRSQADLLESEGHNLADLFRARYKTS